MGRLTDRRRRAEVLLRLLERLLLRPLLRLRDHPRPRPRH